MDYLGIIKQRKVIDGKLYHRYFVDNTGKEIGIPTGIYCASTARMYEYVTNHGIKKQFPDALTFTLKYNNKETQEKALKAIIAASSTMTGNANITCGRRREERTDKDFGVTDLPVGITFNAAHTRHGLVMGFGVSYYNKTEKGFRSTRIYCGTEKTWRQNYTKTLKKAIALREESLVIYRQLTEKQTQ